MARPSPHRHDTRTPRARARRAPRPTVASLRSSLALALAAALALSQLAPLPSAHAQEGAGDDERYPEPLPIVVHLDAPAHLAVGDRAEVIARVRLGHDAGTPLLVTPSSEGPAIEVVRGRLTRADGEQDPDLRELRFRIPLIARTPGTAVVRVRVDGYACRDGRCRAVVVEESLALDVTPRESAGL